MIKKLTAIDLFCGAGGLSEGFRQAGFDILAGNDFDETAGLTYSATHPNSRFFEGPVQDISARDFLSATGLVRGELDCLIGGPPCQAYSVYNHQRGMHDLRSHLFQEYLRIVDGLSPKWIVMENVRGILSIAGGEVVRSIIMGLNELGYRVEMQVLKAEDFGVPQERRRVVFVGTRSDLPIRFPTPTHGHDVTPFTTIKQAIADLPHLKNGGFIGPTKYSKKAQSNYQAEMRLDASLILNHSTPKLSAINLERMKHIPPGGSWRNIPIDLLPEGMKKAKRSDHTKRYGRMTWGGLACTILTKCDVHWGAYIHPEQDRAISVREAARLQSFPDWFEFKGSMTDQYVQIGNAVPPLLGKNIALAILNSSKPRPISTKSIIKTNLVKDLANADF
jgi:DNA (cytosine-5)-methyltransferase 1